MISCLANCPIRPRVGLRRKNFNTEDTMHNDADGEI